jgi:hypothetical protein
MLMGAASRRRSLHAAQRDVEGIGQGAERGR